MVPDEESLTSGGGEKRKEGEGEMEKLSSSMQGKVGIKHTALNMDEELKKNLVIFLIHSSCKLSEY